MTLKRLLKFWLAGLGLITLFLFLRFWIFQSGVVAFDLSTKEAPRIDQEIEKPLIKARSALVMDVESGTVLFQKDPHLQLNPASITKIATAIVALKVYPLDEVVEVEEEYLVGKNMELEAGEKITIRNLIYGLLVHSANDAAFVLAGQREGRKDFVQEMNNFIEQLGLENTHFVNFDGEEDQNHYSSAFDLAHLARWARDNQIFMEAVQKQKMVVIDITGEIEHELETTNELLGSLPEVKGIKTGWTPQSGECFLGLIEIDDHQLITVVLGSEDRFGETRELIQWLKKAVSWSS